MKYCSKKVGSGEVGQPCISICRLPTYSDQEKRYMHDVGNKESIHTVPTGKEGLANQKRYSINPNILESVGQGARATILDLYAS